MEDSVASRFQVDNYRLILDLRYGESLVDVTGCKCNRNSIRRVWFDLLEWGDSEMIDQCRDSDGIYMTAKSGIHFLRQASSHS